MIFVYIVRGFSHPLPLIFTFVCLCLCACMCALKFYSLSKFQLYNIVVSTLVTMLYIRFPDLTHQEVCTLLSTFLPQFLFFSSLLLLISISPSTQPQATTFLPSVSMILIFYLFYYLFILISISFISL